MTTDTTALPRNTVDDLADSDTIPQVLAFLAQARFFEGVSYENDDRVEHGRQLILEWLEASCDYDPEAPEEELSEVPMKTLLYECAEVIYFLHCLQPFSNDVNDVRAGRAQCGYMQVMLWTERRIMRASGIGDDRPHKTDIEKRREREEVTEALEELRRASVN
jgi:hypothetical protein